MMYLEAGQERLAFLGGVVTRDMMKTRKGSLKVKLLGVSSNSNYANVLIKKTGVTCRISLDGIIPYSRAKEKELQLAALKRKYSK